VIEKTVSSHKGFELKGNDVAGGAFRNRRVKGAGGRQREKVEGGDGEQEVKPTHWRGPRRER